MKLSAFFFSTIFSLFAFATDLTVTSEKVPTCFQLSNTAILGAIKDADRQAHISCESPILMKLKANIGQTDQCGFVQVRADYSYH